jgi:cytochrome P450
MSTPARPTTLGDVDLSDNELFRHGFPHEIFSLVRDEAPVWRHPRTAGTERFGGEFWVVASHAEVQAVSRDHARFRSFEGPFLEWPQERQGASLVAMDPPAHTRFRRLISAGLTPRMIARLEDQVRAWAGGAIDAALDRGECDFVTDVAFQVPMHMIADIVGIPVADRAWLFERVVQFLRALDPSAAVPDDERVAVQVEIFEYAHELGAQKRRSPTDDVWTALTTAEIELEDGTRTRLTELELDEFFIILTAAGSDTAKGAIAGGLVAFDEHPEQLDCLRHDPAMMPTAVEEILRWTSPAHYFRRTATDDVVLRGETIRAGEPVTVWYPSANRDAAVFADPFRFDVTRADNPHVTFGGGGIHYCMGANLARREVRVTFEELCARVGRFEILGEPVYSAPGLDSSTSLTMTSLPVRLTPR